MVEKRHRIPKGLWFHGWSNVLFYPWKLGFVWGVSCLINGFFIVLKEILLLIGALK